ncbi:hypothetical protein [Sphingomonas sp. 1185]|uniref:hypothetical protein n=1 Tax=Sphingomonas sp. 1185 TaxID=3156411 RepID=UPI0033956954
MIETIFRQAAFHHGWSDKTQTAILLRYASHAGSPATLRRFLARAQDAVERDDPFTDAVIAILRNPGLALDESFHRFCIGCRDLLTPQQAAERWCLWRAA